MANMSSLTDQQDALEAVRRELVAFLPPGNRGGELSGIFLTSTAQIVSHAYRENGEREGVGGDSYRLHKEIARLRDIMFVPGAGTWFSTNISLDADGHLSSSFDYDSEPDWDTADVDPVAYVNDAKKFPRDEANQPHWLRARLAEGRKRIADGGPRQRD
jgi:hypothetical protein